MRTAGRQHTLRVLLPLLLVVATIRRAQAAGQRDPNAQRGNGSGHSARRAAAEAAAAQLAAIQPAALLNISGTYHGDWSKQAWPDYHASQPLLQSRGTTILKLRYTGESQGGVAGVKGEMVLRDGQFVTAGDPIFSIQGVYVPDTGKLMGVVTAMQQQFRLPTAVAAASGKKQQQQQQEQHGQGQGQGQGRGIWEEASLWEDGSLTAVARQAAGLSASSSDGGLGRLQEYPDPAARFKEASRWRQCEFTLELQAAPAPAAAGAAAAAAAGAEAAAAEAEAGEPGQDGRGDSLFDGRRRLRQQVAVHHGPGASPPGDLALAGMLSSRNCGIQLSVSLTTAHSEQYYAKALNFTTVITLLGFLQVLLLVRQMDACATPALASRVSLLMLAHQAVLDAYLCLVHLTLGILIDSLFHSFGTVAFIQFVVFAIFEMRLLLSAWRARRGSMDPWTAQREVSVLYARFYAGLLGGILLTYQLQGHMPLLLFGVFSFWWPQIWLCLRHDCRSPLTPEYVLGTSAARLAVPLYIYLCPGNLLRVPPNPTLCAALVAYVALQCAALLAQYWRGPRCFIPKQLLPTRYDYSRPVPSAANGDGGDIETGEGGRQCVVCLGPVDIASKAERATTPCNHVFHAACLERWMQVKHDCPTCRRPLPPL